MTTLIKSVQLDEAMMWVELTDGRRIGVPLTDFPRLSEATAEQRNQFVISGGGVAIHWDRLDEDISLDGLLAGRGDLTGDRRTTAHRP